MSVKKCVLTMFMFILMVGLFTSKSYATEKLDLKLRLKPGQKYGMRVVKENNISQTILKQQHDLKHTKTVEMDFEVKEVDANDIASIKVTYQSLQEKSEFAAGQIEYDSRKDSWAIDNPLSMTYSPLIGQSFTVRITPKGEIVELKGIDEMFSQMAEKIIEAEDKLMHNAQVGTCERNTNKPDTEETISKEQIARRRIEKLNEGYGGRSGRIKAVEELIRKHPVFAKEQFREIVSNVIMPFPDGPVEMDDSWQCKESMGKELPVEMDNIYTLKEYKEGAVIVDINSKVSLDSEATGTKKVSPGQMDMQLTGTGTYEGTIEVDGSTGWVIRKKAKMVFSGEMSQQGTKVPMSMESIVTVEPSLFTPTK